MSYTHHCIINLSTMIVHWLTVEYIIKNNIMQKKLISLWRGKGFNNSIAGSSGVRLGIHKPRLL